MTIRDLPGGTVTFLFTDVEGSTRLLQEHGAGYAELLAEHRRALREAFARHGGIEVDTQGDAFFVVFTRATDAIAAADEARAALAPGPVHARMGLHTGEPIVTDEGYVGMDVHRAARIAASAHGGQIVLSETTRRLVDGTGMLDLGEHRLKDLVGGERLYQLGEGDFPPLRTLDATNLPIAGTPLVGRESEVEELVSVLSAGTRLLTVTGPGGTGKTRLALQVAAELDGTLHDGVFWVPLVGLSDGELVLSEIAQAVGAPDDLPGFLRERELLLVLDTFEHLLDAAPAVADMLAAAGGLRVLVTSRAPLHVYGEREYRLEPLSPSAAAILFVERARAVGTQLRPDATVLAICRRLDCLPLALELAAARTKLLGSEGLLDRLESALPLLTGGARDAHERQRTLRATIEWSYDLLDEDARGLLARVAVFSGSFSLAAAEEVSAADLDGIAVLVDSSLLKAVGDGRFLLMETVREYALERLADAGDVAALRERHAVFFSALAEQAYAGRFDAEAEWSRRIELDHDDFRTACDWLSQSAPDQALGLAGALGWFWLSRGLLEEGCRRLADVLAASREGDRARARALAASGALVARHGDLDAGRQQLEEAIELWRALGDRDGARVGARLARLAAHLRRRRRGRRPRAFEQSLELRRELGDPAGMTRSIVGVCQVLVALGDVDRAEPMSRDLLERAGDDPRTEHFAYHFLADCALIRGDTVEAEQRYRQSLQSALPLGDVIETSFEVQGVAMAVAGNGEAERGLRLAASVEALRESLGISISIPFWDALLERYLGPARARLGAEAPAVWAEGRALAFDDAVELALSP